MRFALTEIAQWQINTDLADINKHLELNQQPSPTIWHYTTARIPNCVVTLITVWFAIWTNKKRGKFKYNQKDYLDRVHFFKVDLYRH